MRPETREPKVEFYSDDAGEFRWRVKAANGEIVATGEGHTRLADAERAFDRAESLMLFAAKAHRKDLDAGT